MIDSGSFRDPDGFIFEENNEIYRQINQSGAKNYEMLMSGGLYESLVHRQMIVKHTELSENEKEGLIGTDVKAFENCHKIIRPERIDFISYPYEWSFEQLKDAAMLTLHIQTISLEHGMTLKDASAYNVQFHRGCPVFIDTLSFEAYEESAPWSAYRQFCEHFLAPLALMKYTDVRLSSLLKSFLDGIPLDLAASLLPKKTCLTPTLSLHIHAHAKAQKKHENMSGQNPAMAKASLSKKSLQTLITSLELFIDSLELDTKLDSEWADYYDHTNYSNESFAFKKEIVGRYINLVQPESLWDMGANTGVFSRIAACQGIRTIAFDIDPLAVNRNYKTVKKVKEKTLLPLLFDMTNPSPALGWDNNERKMLKQRGRPDMLMSLALVHHLAISNNLPLSKIAAYFSGISRYAIVEFVPKEDSQVQRLLAYRKDIFAGYTPSGFEESFQKFFNIIEKTQIGGTCRSLYLFEKK